MPDKLSLENYFNIPDSSQKLTLPKLSLPTRLDRTGVGFTQPTIQDNFNFLENLTPAVPESTIQPLVPTTEGSVDATTGASKPNELSIAPGITAPGGKQVTPPPEKGIGSNRTNQLLNSVINPVEGVKRIKLPDGTEIEGITPADIQQNIANANTAISNSNASKTPESAGGFLDFLGSPTFGYITGKLAQAVAPYSPGIQAAGGLGADLAKNQIANEYTQAVKTGEGLDNPRFNILSQDEKQKAVEGLLAQRRQTALEEVYSAQAEQARATAAGTLTRTEKLDLEAQDRASKLEIAQIGDNNWMNIGQGYVFNIDTGTVKKAYNYQTGGSGTGTDIKSADYNQFMQLTASTYLPKAKANYLATLSPQERELQRFTDIFKEQDGSINFSRVMENLTDEERVNFASDLGKYAQAVGQGIDRTSVFTELERERALNNLMTQLESGQEVTANNKRYKLNKDGLVEEIK